MRIEDSFSIHPVHYLLVGNYGVGNLGDEALREYFLQIFPCVEWSVSSRDPLPHELPRFPGGVRSLLFSRWLRTIRALRRSDGIVFGGGSLFTDLESCRACFLWALPAFFAYLLKKPYFLAFQGIGPFRTRLGEQLARWVARHAAFISVRDLSSRDRLLGREASAVSRGGASEEQHEKVWKLNTECIQTFDPVLSLIHRKNNDRRIKKLITFIPKFSTGLSDEDSARLWQLFRGLQEEQWGVSMVSFQKSQEEEELCRKLTPHFMVLSSLEEAPELLCASTGIITQRYHGALVALALRIPFLAITSHPLDKLASIAQFCHCPSLPLADLSLEQVLHIPWEDLRAGLDDAYDEATHLLQRGEEALRSCLAQR